MKKQNNFGKAFLLGTALILAGGSVRAEEVAFFDENVLESDMFLADTFEDDSDWVEVTEEPCDEDSNFIQIVEEEDSWDDVVSLSRPAGYQTTSVRESMKQEDVSDNLYISFDEEELTTIETDKADTLTDEILTEELVAKQYPPAEENLSAKDEAFITIPGNKIPLKKVKTTITETTTKIQKSQTDDHIKTGDTLNEKLAYGTSVHDWEAYAGATLRELLLDWGGKSGWTVVWKLDRDYHLEAGVIFRGTFTDASSALIRSFARATPAPIGTFYQGNRVLVINTVEDENER